MKYILMLIILFVTLSAGQDNKGLKFQTSKTPQVIYSKDSLGVYHFNKTAIDDLINENYKMKYYYNDMLSKERLYRRQVDSLQKVIGRLKK